MRGAGACAADKPGKIVPVIGPVKVTNQDIGSIFAALTIGSLAVLTDPAAYLRAPALTL